MKFEELKNLLIERKLAEVKKIYQEMNEYDIASLIDELPDELLVKALLNNGRSLENQIADLGAQLKIANASSELRNMVTQIIKYYTDFQNNHVKHNDAVNENEIEYVIELTSVVMKYLIKVLG